MDWISYRKHREYVIKTRGFYLGLMDNNMEPIAALPYPTKLSAGELRLAPSDLEMTIPLITSLGFKNITTDYFLGDNLGATDEMGRLKPMKAGSLFVLYEAADGFRRVYKVLLPELSSDNKNIGKEATIKGVDPLGFGLSLIPAMSAPYSWKDGGFEEMDRDWVGVWSKKRLMTDIKMAERADGFTIEGTATQAIHRIISESFEAAFILAGINDNPPYKSIIIDSGIESPRAVIRVTDDYILDEVAEYAKAANVDISAVLVLPGDDKSDIFPEEEKPTIYFTVKQG